jgi:CubicO group peptidase (beta-lactamase class C family)
MGKAKQHGFSKDRLQRIDRFLQEKYVGLGHMPCAQFLLARNGEVIHQSVLGFQDQERGVKLAEDTVFRLYSMTKPVACVALLTLVEEGLIALDDPVAKHIPEWANLGVFSAGAGPWLTTPTARPMQVVDLMRHTSGLPGGYPKGLEKLYDRRDHSLAEACLVLAQRPLEFEPGSKWAYCNAGIDTLGRLVEVVSGTRFEDRMQTKVLIPLGMKETSFYPSPQQLKRLAHTYDRKNGKLVDSGTPLTGPPAGAKHPIPAGGLYSTADDLSRLYRAMLLGGELNGTRVISSKALEEMTRLQTGDIPCGFVEGMGFGLGWAHVKTPKGVTAMLSTGTYGHGGAYGTQAWIDPKQDLFIILLIQRTGLGNGDASPMRLALQQAAVKSVSKNGSAR